MNYTLTLAASLWASAGVEESEEEEEGVVEDGAFRE